MNELTNVESSPATVPPSEAVPLAQELARAHARLVSQLREQHGLNTPEAARRAERMPSAEVVERYADGPSEALTWHNLDAITRHNPPLAAEVWERLRTEAREELITGHRAAKIVETADANCLNRARFLAIRDELTSDWPPTTGQERILIDVMAQAIATQEHWLRRMMLLDSLENDSEEPSEYQTPRLPTATAIEQAANMVDRFNRIFMRALRQLRDLRRYTPQVIVKNAGQVNLGSNLMNLP
jgi:hypothetical protein